MEIGFIPALPMGVLGDNRTSMVHSPHGELVHVEARWVDQIIQRSFEVV